MDCFNGCFSLPASALTALPCMQVCQSVHILSVWSAELVHDLAKPHLMLWQFLGANWGTISHAARAVCLFAFGVPLVLSTVGMLWAVARGRLWSGPRTARWGQWGHVAFVAVGWGAMALLSQVTPASWALVTFIFFGIPLIAASVIGTLGGVCGALCETAAERRAREEPPDWLVWMIMGGCLL